MNRYIDVSFGPQESLLLRYHELFASQGLSLEDLRAVHLHEGARVFLLPTRNDVSVYVVDETTLMAGGSYKALEAAICLALSRKQGHRQIAFSSGANTGICLTLYAQKAGIETFFFHPSSTAWKLAAETFSSPTSHLISVDQREKEVKRAAMLFARRRGIPHVPDEETRHWASGQRALFAFEYARDNRLRFDWVAQAVCAGFGPIAFYRACTRLVNEGAVDRGTVPKFLGLQQEALAPMVTAWQKRHARIEAADVGQDRMDLMVPNLYNTNPAGSYPELYDCLQTYGGALCAVGQTEFQALLPEFTAALKDNGIALTRLPNGERESLVERAGLLGLAGALCAIDRGVIGRGQTVLCFMTGGAAKHSGRQAQPEFSIARDDDLEEAVERYLARV